MGYGAETEKRLLIEQLAADVGTRLPAEQAQDAARFVSRYYRGVAIEDLLQRPAEDLIGAAISHWRLLTEDSPTPRIRAYNPEPEQHGWQSTHSVVQIVTDDMPFLVDSVSMAFNRRGYTIHLIVHPVMPVRRDAEGRIHAVADDGADGCAACMHFEIDRQADQSILSALADKLGNVIGDVHLAVTDWQAMLAKLIALADETAAGPPIAGQDRSEAAAFLRWLADEHFTLLGYRSHDLIRDGDQDVLRAVPGSGLGILRKGSGQQATRSFSALPREVQRRARDPELLIVTKSNSRSTVHRPSYMDYIGIKRFDEHGEVIGEHRFLGLYTSPAYNSSPLTIPLLRKKVSEVLERAGLPPRSHAGKALLHILDTYPRDELFQIDTDTLYDIALGILHLQERQRTRLFVRNDRYQRFVSCLVYAPRERYNTEVRRRMQALLQKTFGAQQSEFSVQLSESVLARIHFIVRLPVPGLPKYDHAALEALLAQTMRSWRDDFESALLEQFGEPHGNQLLARYRDAFPGAYRADIPPRLAALDTERLEQLDARTPLVISLYRVPEQPPELLRLKLYHRGRAIPLSEVLPMLENMGVTVLEERPYEVRPAQEQSYWIHDFGLRHPRGAELDAERSREDFQRALAAVWHGHAEDDGFNRLTLDVGLPWEEVVILRAYAKYLRQAGTTLSQAYIELTLARYPHITRKLVALFHARLDPDRRDDDLAAQLAEEIGADLGAVPTLDEDRILRRYLAAIGATLRCNYYQRDAQGRRKPYLAFKLAPERIPDMPQPHPKFEIFVYAPYFEGVHLRGGKVARGGIRHSDRREDFRTEVLGLMKAQMVKNAVIVPVGAKGGFYCKRLPAGADREAVQAEVRRCYADFIRGLLDLTDNRRGSEIVPPPALVRHDEDDPYLVVAADKGTATFSDLANSVAKEYGFWLDDAFASGGSAGYDHKKMGITARGAWEAVKRHFRELGMDIQQQDFTCVGIGDMSGDVFGNGMLQSRHTKLIAAFDHRHIFIDPDPDPQQSYDERCRLFQLPRSSWADYDPAKLSAGGGVYPRSAKVIELSAEARRALGTEQTRFSPDELIRAVLRAPVDLLWNGGIGTYCKASDESNAEVGDKTNDPLRVDAADLRCRVVGEGGNLGFTQRGRIEYALRGGRINTDAIDNSGGVDCSDHEVNIKILLNQTVEDGELTLKQRNRLLAEMTEEVATLVLTDNYQQTQALSLAQARGSEVLDEHARFIRALERAGALDRKLEFLPDDETLATRSGLTRPEQAVLLAYAKISANRELLADPLLDAPFMASALLGYFPRPLERDFAHAIAKHRLRREITATVLSNQIINRMGMSFFFRIGEQLGVGCGEIARAYLAARDIFELEHWWRQVDELDNRIGAERQIRLQLALIDLQEQATLWLLRNLPRPLDVELAIDRLKPQIEPFWQGLAETLPGAMRERLAAREAESVREGVPAALARRVAARDLLFAGLDIAKICRQTGSELFLTAGVYFCAAERLDLDWLRAAIDRFPAADPWQERFRAGLEDEVYLQLRRLGAEIIGASAESGAEARVEAWLKSYATLVERIRQTLAELKTVPKLELAMLAVAVQQLKQLVQAAGARALEHHHDDDG